MEASRDSRNKQKLYSLFSAAIPSAVIDEVYDSPSGGSIEAVAGVLAEMGFEPSTPAAKPSSDLACPVGG